ncbi:hypothetical protein IMCC3317_06190 [Kordia antarctica]|uniref:Uncharacterized protein n=1 Tax=Kordia antarctica TaxID=1218801 RepID=A0A7L4ZF08_9FLAO|nr:hypothetical protein [Kordia antarctica]QHI35273.1 hypothetical protein IMCC3317_06190 [Kordia antarctica]
MKKSNLTSLKLNKDLISSLHVNQLNGGNWTNNSWCACETERNCTDTECHTVWDCEL